MTTKTEKKYNILLALSCVLLVIFSCVFGCSLDSSLCFATLIGASNFENNQFFTHVEINEYEYFSYDELMSVCRSMYGKKKTINSYLSTEFDVDFEICDFSTSWKICSVPVYSDKKEMEVISLPLYLEDSSIGKGPLNGANFASYIPSSFADVLVEKGYFESYDDILSSQCIFKLIDGDRTDQFSINNIYLNNKSSNWNNQNDLDNGYYEHFSLWNSSSIFAYCPALFRECYNACFYADVREGYGNLKVLFDSISSNLPQRTTATLFSNKDIDKKMSVKVLSSNKADSFEFLQIAFLVALLTSLGLTIYILYLSFIKRICKKTVLAICYVSFCFLVISEVIKTIFKVSVNVHVIFNLFFNLSLMFLIICASAYILLLKGREKNEIKTDFLNISI